MDCWTLGKLWTWNSIIVCHLVSNNPSYKEVFCRERLLKFKVEVVFMLCWWEQLFVAQKGSMRQNLKGFSLNMQNVSTADTIHVVIFFIKSKYTLVFMLFFLHILLQNILYILLLWVFSRRCHAKMIITETRLTTCGVAEGILVSTQKDMRQNSILFVWIRDDEFQWKSEQTVENCKETH